MEGGKIKKGAKDFWSSFFIFLLLSILFFSFVFSGTVFAQGLDGDGIPDSEDLETIVSTKMTLEAGEYTFKNLIVTNNSVLTLSSDISLEGFKGVKINAESITIEAGSSISADGKGYGSDSGPGTGLSACGIGGGGYGGKGGGPCGGPTYGLAISPTDPGSGGGGSAWGSGGPGGGAIRLIVSNTLTNDGAISAEVTISFDSLSPVNFDGKDKLSLKVLTRIGGFCGGHSSAVGLRLYFDGVSRPSRFDVGVINGTYKF